MGLLNGLEDYYAFSNRESGLGRYDICLKSMEEYERELMREGYREVLCYGIAFYKKSCRIKLEKHKLS